MPKNLRKAVASVLVPILVMLWAVLLYVPADASAALTATTKDYLNLRKGAGTNTGVVLTLGKNVSVTVIDNSDAQWAKVQTQNGREGYCFKQYLNFGGSSPSGTGSQSGGNAVTTSNLNLRDSANLSGHVILIVAKGSPLKLLDNSDAQWAKVQSQSGKQGYCCKTYLKISGSPSNAGQSTNSGSPSGNTAKTTDYLNMRKGAGTNYKVILTMGKGVTVTVLDNSNSTWAEVRTQNGVDGWCSKQYLNISKAPSQQASSPSTAVSSMPVSSTSASGNSANTENSTHTITGATVTVSMLRLREQPNTSSSILDNLPKNTVLKVIDTSVSGWIKVETSAGKTGYVSSNYVKINYSDGDNGTPSGDSNLSISATQENIPLGKTFYLKVLTNASGGVVNFTSSNPAVASVSDGFVFAAGKGDAVITATNGSHSAECKVTVKDAEPVRTAYASPNVACTGAAIIFTAVTDSSRDGAKFVITAPGGGTTTVNAGNCTEDTVSGITTKNWTGSTSLPAAGEYSVAAYSSINGVWSASAYNTNVYVTSQSDPSATTDEDHHVSDKMISLIAAWEGYRPAVEKDELTSSLIPTVGYGQTISQNTLFYNYIGKTEALSDMVNLINKSSYTSELNKMVKNNNFKISQYQADCLISFAYNVGPGYFNGSNAPDFKQIMKNAVVPPDFGSGTQISATVTKDAFLMANAGTASGSICTVAKGTSVTVTDCNFSDKKDGWYKVNLADGAAGWINSGYVSLSGSENMTHDLNYTNAYAFGTEFIRWSLASGKFYTGLFYRRLVEANVYSYGDYSVIKYNKYGYNYPSSAVNASLS